MLLLRWVLEDKAWMLGACLHSVLKKEVAVIVSSVETAHFRNLIHKNAYTEYFFQSIG